MTQEKVTVVVLGASGRVGGQLAKMLQGRGLSVRAVSRDAAKLFALKNQGAEIIEASLTDSKTLTDAFKHAKVVFLLSPLNLQAVKLNEEQFDNVRCMVKAVRDAGIKRVVVLSSWGVELAEKSGGIQGCRFLEKELEKIHGLNSVILRPVWFMENFLYNIDLIKMSGINGQAINPDIPFPMIATIDIAAVAMQYLLDSTFTGRQILYLKSSRKYTMREVTEILGKQIGLPKLKYLEFPPEILKQGLVGSKQLSADGADMLIEINQCISTRKLKIDPQAKVLITSNTFEDFARNKFAPAFRSAQTPPLHKKIQGLILRLFLMVSSRPGVSDKIGKGKIVVS